MLWDPDVRGCGRAGVHMETGVELLPVCCPAIPRGLPFAASVVPSNPESEPSPRGHIVISTTEAKYWKGI